ncbi:hypothetical protein Cgig2_011592 [Carnegiea gigantea]|uniref:Ubiquitin-like protease family profile domain-containing protein n=1 Tax=Carnegiea gigantea TaxID=171969 RepID=A0A9Q1JS89_9CARY|nr:hypothetical protein Cgig2_011592 [Carnegiea gigantea]
MFARTFYPLQLPALSATTTFTDRISPPCISEVVVGKQVLPRKRWSRSEFQEEGQTLCNRGLEWAKKVGEDAKGEGSIRNKTLDMGREEMGKGGRRVTCTLRSLCALHGRMTPYQMDTVMGTTLCPVLEYGEMAMERHLTLGLTQSWDRQRKAFRIAGRQENAEEDRVGIWLRLYVFIVLIGVFFPRTPYGATWSLIQYADDVKHGAVWFYEHTTRFCSQDGERFSQIAGWRKVYHSGIYDANELLAEQEEKEGVLSFDERLRRARVAYVLEKEARGRTREEAAMVKARSEDRGKDGDAGGADEKSNNSVERLVIGNMSDGTDAPRESLKDDAVEQLYNNADHNNGVSVGDTEVQYEGAYSGLDQGTCRAPPPSPNVAQGQNDSADEQVRTAKTQSDDADLKIDEHFTPGEHDDCGLAAGSSIGTDAECDDSQRAPLNMDASGADLEEEVVNDDQFVSVMPITVAPPDEETEDVQPPSSFIPSPIMKAALTREKRSTTVISDEFIKAYLTWTLSADEVNLLSAVHSRSKGLKDGQWNFDLHDATDKHVNVEFLKGLINVVPTRGVGDRSCRYCIGAFAVLMPLFDSVAEHWLLLVGDVKKRRFLVYDSLRSKRDAPRQQLLLSAVSD